MEYSFTKMHGLGNDFVIIQTDEEFSSQDVRAICNRKYGIGCDQLILLRPCPDTHGYVVIYNQDGSFAEACGNAYRCLIMLLSYNNEQKITLNTHNGIISGQKSVGGMVLVNIGKVAIKQELAINQLLPPLITNNLGIKQRPLMVEVGNPHLVIFVNCLLDDSQLREIGSKLSTNHMFNHGINVEFNQVISPSQLQVQVFERGVGPTNACGTGAIASAVAAKHLNLCQNRVEVAMKGGSLYITHNADNTITQQGQAQTVYSGTFNLQDLPTKNVGMSKAG